MQKSVERRATELCGASEDETDGRTTLDVDDGEKMSAKLDQVEKQASQRQQALDALESDKSWSAAQWRAVAVAGSGFLTDSYDNFIIGLMVPMIGFVYFDQSYAAKKYSVPNVESGWLKAASSWGNFTGQLFFGVVGDLIGRKSIYGIALVILIAGALGTALAAQPARGLSIVSMVAFWRFILGVGVGGDYPVSSVITAEFSTTRNRGTLMALVFSMQGIGILLGAAMSCISLLVMKNAINSDYHNLDYVW
ncbi:phosphate transporter, partial [Kappamyces sp. JEL0680]